jgi:hypothetical protein
MAAAKDFTLVDVSAQAAYPATPQVTIGFNAKSIAVIIEDAASTGVGCVVSFDGTTDALHMVAGIASSAAEWENLPFRKVFLKSYGAGATKVRVSADAS